jgi:N utilization substance protein A
MSALTSQSATPLENVSGLGEGLIEKLAAAGITTVEALADMTPEQLEAIEGIGPKTVEKISLAVNNYFSSLEGGEGTPLPEGEAQHAAGDEAAAEAPVEGENQEVVAAAAEETEAGSVDDLAAQAEGGEEEPSAEPKE